MPGYRNRLRKAIDETVLELTVDKCSGCGEFGLPEVQWPYDHIKNTDSGTVKVGNCQAASLMGVRAKLHEALR